ncbi:hypothetical protein Nepgr_007088 [Nepenthes gracilis]|uniref:RRM domain-containing protein n=1 Tax=Nepenthes gracilis TaxID=150966 RepID=A0AAD3XHZ0_NEPGR|nr:hypothetical protein Nepgr_007088 [Nepenthes gracilis]
MKDRITGRARGFGFVIYADSAVAERVVRQKHVLDGRSVEAKKAVPRDEQHIPNKINSSIHGSPNPVHAKKIFVGGLPSTVTESNFKRYFDQFGAIMDVVVMYDHNTQRPRGFGFITYDSEEAVERALVKTFHELNGKRVEVKRAVPKELSPGPSRCGMNRVSNLLNGSIQGYSPSLVGSYGVRMEDRHSPVSAGRSAFPSFNASSYGTTLNHEPRMNGEIANFVSNFNSEWGSNSINRRGGFLDYDDISKDSGSASGSTFWGLWGNGNINAVNCQDFVYLSGLKNRSHAFNSSEAICGSFADSFFTNGNHLSHGRGDDNLRPRSQGYGNLGIGISNGSSYTALTRASFGDSCDINDDIISEVSASFEFKGSDPFDTGLGNAASDVLLKNPALCW